MLLKPWRIVIIVDLGKTSWNSSFAIENWWQTTSEYIWCPTTDILRELFELIWRDMSVLSFNQNLCCHLIVGSLAVFLSIPFNFHQISTISNKYREMPFKLPWILAKIFEPILLTCHRSFSRIPLEPNHCHSIRTKHGLYLSVCVSNDCHHFGHCRHLAAYSVITNVRQRPIPLDCLRFVFLHSID